MTTLAILRPLLPLRAPKCPIYFQINEERSLHVVGWISSTFEPSQEKDNLWSTVFRDPGAQVCHNVQADSYPVIDGNWHHAMNLDDFQISLANEDFAFSAGRLTAPNCSVANPSGGAWYWIVDSRTISVQCTSLRNVGARSLLSRAISIDQA
jgi:hypothetical protein